MILMDNRYNLSQLLQRGYENNLFYYIGILPDLVYYFFEACFLIDQLKYVEITAWRLIFYK